MLEASYFLDAMDFSYHPHYEGISWGEGWHFKLSEQNNIATKEHVQEQMMTVLKNRW